MASEQVFGVGTIHSMDIGKAICIYRVLQKSAYTCEYTKQFILVLLFIIIVSPIWTVNLLLPQPVNSKTYYTATLLEYCIVILGTETTGWKQRA